MNILIIHEIDWIKKVIFEPHHISELLSLQGHNVFVIDCPSPNIKNVIRGLKTTVLDYSRVYENTSIKLIHPPAILLNGLNRISIFFSCKKLISDVVKKNNIDIIFLYGVPTNGKQSIDVAKQAGIPIIYRELDISHEFIKIPILKQITKNIEKFVISNVTKVYACTPGLKNYSETMGAHKENSEYFPLGVNTQIFKPIPRDHSLALNLEINENDLVLIFVGTLYPFSGLDYLLTNFKEIQKDNPDLKLIIVGGGPDYLKTKSLIKINKLEKNVILTGFVSQNDIPKYISLAHLCLNSFRISTITNQIIPVKILEYLACGKPVLSTPLHGTVELLPTEEYGIVYARLQEFQKTITKLLSDDEKLKNLGKSGRYYIQNNHDYVVLTEKLIKKFESLIK